MADPAVQNDEWSDFRSGVADGSAKPAGNSDDWADFRPDTGPVVSSPNVDTTQGISEVMAQQSIGGLIEGTAGLSGMVGGARMGAALPLPGIGKPIATVAGGIGGLILGGMGGEQATEALGIPKPGELPPDQRAAAYGARVVGESLPFVVAPYAAAAKGYQFAETGVGKYLNQIINTAKQSPKMFGTLEATSIASSAGGEYIAETIAPGQTGTRIASGVAAGVFDPIRLTVKTGQAVLNTTKKVLSTISPAARETVAAKRLQELFDAAGEDPALAARILREQGVLDEAGVIVEDGLTAAQITGSRALSALQKYAADMSPDFAAAADSKAKDTLDMMRGLVVQLSRTGDPESLKAAAQIRTTYYRTLLENMVDTATKKAADSAATISKDTPAAREGLSTQARESLNTVISEVRRVERELWSQIDKNVSVDVSNLQREFDSIEAGTLKELRGKQLPPTVRKFLDRVTAPKEEEAALIWLPTNAKGNAPATPVGTNYGEMQQLRSDLLDEARAASDAGEFGKARTLNNLAESILDDIDTAFSQTSSDAYDAARQFTREMNGTFTRSFVGKATATGKYGDRIAPELLLRKALATGKEAGALQLDELSRATKFLDERQMGTELTAEATANMLNAQEGFVRLMFREAVDQNTGVVNPKRLRTLIDQNETLLNRFPEVRQQLEDAVTSEVARKEIETFASNKIKFMEDRKLFTKLAEGDPVVIAQKALTSPDVERQINDMVKTVTAGNLNKIDQESALKGLRSSLFEGAIRSSTDKNGVLNLKEFRKLMYTPSVPNRTSPLSMMRDKGIIDAKEYDLIEKMFGLMDNIEGVKTPGLAVEKSKDMGDAALAFFSRVLGTSMIGFISKKLGMKASIQAHAAGANVGEQVLNKLPALKTDQIFVRALNDRKLMAALLDKVNTPEAAELQARQIHAWLLQSGLYEEQPQDQQAQ